MRQKITGVLIVLAILALCYQVLSLIGAGAALTLLCTTVVLFVIRSYSIMVRDMILKVHKNNITNQEALMKEIKRGNKN